MTKQEIITELIEKGYNSDAAATQQDLYTIIRRNQLFSNANRLNSGWTRGKYVIACYADDDTQLTNFLEQWRSKVLRYQNQILCLEITPNNWQFYDYAGNQIEFNVKPPQLQLPLTTDEGTENNNQHRNLPLQQIFYGAPGTGKSNTIKKEVDEKKKICFRTTFHPDSDYSTFVGCYKPTKKPSERIYTKEELVLKLNEIKTSGTTYPCQKFGAKYWESLKELSTKDIKDILAACDFTDNYTVEIAKSIGVGQECLSQYDTGKITYKFVPQAFTKAYTEAWKTEEDVFLIIEEINRGNCAQIFGDLFQLLDRKDGVSEYPVDADTDLQDHLSEVLAETTRTDIPEEVKSGKKLMLPSNLYIWATMNTSDQSLFPIDSAFKRRWDWKYIPIENAEKNWKIEVNGYEYDWYEFLEAINKEVLDLTHSEDKQLGYFFAKAKDNKIDAETLVNKVYFYLWTDVFKDYEIESLKAFRKPNSNEAIAFKDFFKKGGVNEEMAEQVLINLELEKQPKPTE